jgi:hypothetical protein
MNASLMSDMAKGSLEVVEVRGRLRALCDSSAAVLPPLLPPTLKRAVWGFDAG